MNRFLLVVWTVLLFVSCDYNASSYSAIDEKSQQALHNDSLIFQAKHTLSIDTVFALVDSLEQIHAIGPIRANYERGHIYNLLKEDCMCEKYWKLAATSEAHGQAEERYNYRAIIGLAHKYQIKHDFEGALRLSVPSVAKMKKSGIVSSADLGTHLGDIGICHLKTKRFAEADKCFEESFAEFRKGIASDTTLYTFEKTLVILNNTVLFCIDAHQYDAAMRWSLCVDSLIQVYCQQPQADSAQADKQYARMCNNRSRIVLAKGNRQEALKWYERYQHTKSYQDGSQRFPGEFQLEAGLYSEAVKSYADIENEIRRRVDRPSLDIIQQYVFPKFRANAGAGNKDSAIAVGLRIMTALDSAIAWQKQDEAAELSAIYETQEKDLQIVEQQTSLSHQRFVAAIIVLAIVVLALVLFIFFRHRAAMRLELAHEQLKGAYDQLEEATAVKERMASELRIARDIQMSMVPSEFPHREGLDLYAAMTPAKEVGGDLYGYQIEGDKLYFAVGDVSGKGVPASLFMAQATRLFLTLAKQGMMPAEICTRINAALSGEDNQNGMFVTMFIGLVDLQTGHLLFCNAGHNPPVIGGGLQQGEFLKMESNAPIGLWPDLHFVGEEIESIKNRPLFVYTDGLNEAENPQRQQFGEARLIDALRRTRYSSSQQVVEALAAEIEKHRQGTEPNDDLTMMCLKVS